jgi:hypothetical protein
MVDFREVPAGRVDPDVKLPSAVKNASAAIERYYESQKANVAAPPAAAPIVPPVKMEVSDAPPPQPSAAPPEPPPAADPPVVASSDPPASPEPVDPPAEPDEAPTKEQIQADPWANRYNAMRGRLGAETKKFNAAVAQKDKEILELHNRLSQLSDEVVKSSALLSQVSQRQHVAPPTPPMKLVREEDIERHGEDTIDFVKRAAQEALEPQLRTLVDQNKQLNQELSRSRRAIMNADLTREVPTWREVNKDPRFLQWLRQPNIYSGQTNKELLDAAVRSADAQRVAAFFKGFLSEEKATGQRDDTGKTAPPTPAPRTPAVDLRTLASPGSGKPATGTDQYTPPSKPIYKRSDFEKVRRDKLAGRYTAEQAAALDRDMHAAIQEGRIING